MTDLSQAADVVKRLRNTAVVISKVPFGPITAALLNEAADLIEALLAERVSAETMAWAQQEAAKIDATERPDAESMEELRTFRRRIKRNAVIEECIAAALGVGNFGHLRHEELTTDFGRPRFDMMNEVVEALRALQQKEAER